MKLEDVIQECQEVEEVSGEVVPDDDEIQFVPDDTELILLESLDLIGRAYEIFSFIMDPDINPDLHKRMEPVTRKEARAILVEIASFLKQESTT